ncbi:MAG TPA: 16S rRNA (cytidine(1402)-2'-O)-methyltransferase [Desulfobacteraceae bacterium]|nr:16S rRNA (cytidine(1402)-2'-O)-methyltransferase [Desulfobacteraceae bacterium]
MTGTLCGTLYIVATPMGNLEDITFRAVRTLKEADIIAAEDTRHSRKLLNHYGITTPMTACHEHNEAQRISDLIQRLESGQSVALISDAGTPLISDPGYTLVRTVSEHRIPVVPIPGCNAAVTGLSAAGLPTDAFLFCGFPPKKQARLSKALTALKSQTATLIFYESPKRIKTLVKASLETLGDRDACLCRELTKRHEEFLRSSLSELSATLSAREQIKGECILLISGATDQPAELGQNDLEDVIRRHLTCDSPPRTGDLAKELSSVFNLPKKQVYDTILRVKQTV